MRNGRSALNLLLVALLFGCSSVPFNRTAAPAPGLRVTSATPSAPELVAVLNDNAHRIQALECRDVDLDCTEGNQSVGLRADMVCQKPRNFRMHAKVMGNTAVDMGSNEREFWFWISKANPPYLFHCAYQDLQSGQVQAAMLPFQPDWILEAVGMGEYDPAKPYQVMSHGNSVDLVENTLSPQRQPVRKVTRLTRSGNRWQVAAHVLQDTAGKDICSAYVTDQQFDTASGAVVPRRVQLDWPELHVRMKIRLDRVAVNPASIDTQRAALLFTRPNLRDVPSYDLARGLDAPTGPLRPAGAFSR